MKCDINLDNFPNFQMVFLYLFLQNIIKNNMNQTPKAPRKIFKTFASNIYITKLKILENLLKQKNIIGSKITTTISVNKKKNEIIQKENFIQKLSS
jgi:hypothetical protein